MIGCLVLTTQRSGSNWLSELITNAGTMGNCTEWLHGKRLGARLPELSCEELTRELLARAATPNGRFSCKMMPPHLHAVHRATGVDLIRHLRREHTVSFVLLRRRDRMRQAISLARSRMTGLWKVYSEKRGEERYDFDLICECYFATGRAYQFWQDYLDIQELDYRTFFYEDMLESTRPCLEWIAGRLDVPLPELPEASAVRIQRDTTTEEWLERFRADLERHDVMGHTRNNTVAARTPANLMRLIRKKPLTPFRI